MRLVRDPLFSEVDLMASVEELSRLAGAVAVCCVPCARVAWPGRLRA
jgi:hypothetical protein